MASFGLGRAPQESTASSEAVDVSTPWMAASDGNLSLLRSSLESLNLKPTAVDGHGYSLLHAAAAYGQLQVMDWLIVQQRVPVNVVDSDGDSPLHHVEHVDAARKLVQVGNADVHVRNKAGKTPLQTKQDELDEMMHDEEDDDDSDDVLNLRDLVAYLSSVAGAQ